MKPSPANNEEGIADAVESWGIDELDLRKMDPITEELPDVYRMTALKCPLPGKIQEHVELQPGRLMTYSALRQEIMTYAVQMRRQSLERNKNHQDNRMVDEVEQESDGWWGYGKNIHYEGDGYQDTGIDALAKGRRG